LLEMYDVLQPSSLFIRSQHQGVTGVITHSQIITMFGVFGERSVSIIMVTEFGLGGR
jgi:hypothetical protein